MGLYERYDKTVSTADIHAEIADRLREELDYEREAAHMRLYGEILRNEPGVAVPRPIAELSTRRLLTMTWLEGSPILEVAENAPIELRNELALRMFRLWYVPFYYYGVIHGDPHLGNYTVAPEKNGERTVNLLDFGCVRIFPARFVKGVIDLYHALERDDRELAVEAYRSWGFGDLSHELIDVLNRWARFVYGPLLDDRARMIQERAKPGADGQHLIDDVHRDLRRLGGIAPPRAFVFMDRAAVGLGLGVPAPAGAGQLAPPVPRADRGFRRSRARRRGSARRCSAPGCHFRSKAVEARASGRARGRDARAPCRARSGPRRALRDVAAQGGERRRDDVAGIEAGGLVLRVRRIVVEKHVRQDHRADLQPVVEHSGHREVVQHERAEPADRAFLDRDHDLVLAREAADQSVSSGFAKRASATVVDSP